MEDLFSNPAIASTVDFPQIKNGYWMSMNLHGPLNPKDRIPMNSEPFLPKVSLCDSISAAHLHDYSLQPYHHQLLIQLKGASVSLLSGVHLL